MISSPDFSYGRCFILRVHKKTSVGGLVITLKKTLITSSFTVECHLEAVLKANYKVRLYLSFHQEIWAELLYFLLVIFHLITVFFSVREKRY